MDIVYQTTLEADDVNIRRTHNRICIAAAAILYLLWLILWAMQVAHNEVLTVLHQHEFRDRYTDWSMRANETDLVLCKVISYTNDEAQVYYVMDHGNAAEVYTFVKNINNDWVFSSSNCLWSQGGNADEMLWPYIGQYFLWKII